MKGGKQLRRVCIGSTGDIITGNPGSFAFRTADIVLNEYHVRPDDIVSVCMYDGNIYVYYLSES